MSKSADAFRTISEVADWLDTPAHVLRFWESKFSQVKPVKRAGGRRYYRPADMRLLGGIKKLLHEDGMTIKGAQKILREKGIRHVASLCTLSVGDEDDIEDAVLQDVPASDPVATVVPFTKPTEPDTMESAPEESELEAEIAKSIDVEPEVIADNEVSEDEVTVAAVTDEAESAEPEVIPGASPPEPMAASADEGAQSPDAHVSGADSETASLPGFLQHSMEDRIDAESPDPEDAAVKPPAAAIDVPPPAPAEPTPGALTLLASIKRLSPESARQIAPLVENLLERVR